MESLKKFTDDPVEYLETSANNADKMSTKRKISVITRSTLIGTGVGLCTFALSILTGSNHACATSAAVTTGIAVGGANGVYEAHGHGMMNQTGDKVKEGLKKFFE